MLADKVRIGIIGAGGIAQGAHIPGYKRVADQVELVAIADVVEPKARQAAADHGFKTAYASYEEMLAKESLDAVSVCVPNKFHAPVAIAALQAGCHVICEKPPATTGAEARAMADAAARAGRVLTFGFHFRFMPEVEAARRFAEDGAFGEIYFGRVTAQRRRGIPGWGVFTNKELQGGGPLIDIGVHALDACLYVMGYPDPSEVLGVTYTKLGDKAPTIVGRSWNYKDYTVEDVCNALIRFADGATLMLESSFIANIEPTEEMNVRLSGTRAGLKLFPLTIFGEEHGLLVNKTAAWQPRPAGGNAHLAEIAHFVRCVRGEATPRSNAAEAVKISRLIEAIYKSAASGQLEKV